MKQIKKMTWLVLAMVMVLAMTVTASASGTQQEKGGSITITNATKDETYTIYRVFDATVSKDSEGNDIIAYSWPEDSVKEWAENDYFAKDERGNISAKEAAFKKDTEGNLLEDQLSEGAIEWVKKHGIPLAAIKAIGDRIEFSNLKYGYYFVTSTLKDNGAITVTSTLPNVTIIDKNQTPSWDDKVIVIDPDGDNETKVKVSDNAYEDEVTFEINVNATNYYNDEKILEYYITDTLDEGLEYNQNTVVVKVGTKTLDAAKNEYQITWEEVEGTDTPHSFKITIPWVDNTEAKTLLYSANTVINVRYTADVDTDAEIAGNGNKNKAQFNFRTEKDDPGKDPDHKSEERETTTYTYALGIQKTDDKGNVLKGAEFTIKDSETDDGNTIGGVPVDGAPGVYRYTEDTSAAGYTTVFKTGDDTTDNGQLVIKGVTVGSYYVTEAKAPNGYNLLTSPEKVEAKRDSVTTYKTSYTIYYDADGNVVKEEVTGGSTAIFTFPVNVAEITVVNKAGSVLPSTGGIGTTIFYVFGGLLIFASSVLLITRKRMSR